MRMLNSFAGRLVASLILVTVAVGLVAAGTGSITLHREINEAMDSSMQEAARRLLPVVIDDLFGRETSQSPRKLGEAVPDDDGGRMVFQVRDGAGHVLMHSYGAPAEPLTIKLAQGFSEEAGWRVYTEPAVSGTVFVQVAELDTRRNEETFEAAIGFLIPMVILIPLSALVAWLTLGALLEADRYTPRRDQHPSWRQSGSDPHRGSALRTRSHRQVGQQPDAALEHGTRRREGIHR
ncbi:sensor histidine kinase N-terminal domain-containing protein [Mesorhizobium sp. Cs1299R1N1]|uniref:sensor histidine kinase N-terminal domain-containing protein n=1 Tax=Mesorhizobium sp. Cs1299R1N1 TaxID=3015172 RepID=UPI00301DF33E